MPQDLAHIYIKLDFKNEHENARSAEDARGFLSSVARASAAAQLLAERYGGTVLEVQGALIHAALPNNLASVEDFAAHLHAIYRTVFDNPDGRVLGWRMAADGGRTLVVAGRGVHGDDSYVSLGRSANGPARYIYAQLELPEEQRLLKRFCLGTRDQRTDRWKHVDLNVLRLPLAEARSIGELARATQPHLEFQQALSTPQEVSARTAASIPSIPDRPYTYFGWVIRCDLDGFTSRVEECFDNNQRLQELADLLRALAKRRAQQVLALARECEALARPLEVVAASDCVREVFALFALDLRLPLPATSH